MAESSLDALVCTAPSDVLLLTGYWPIMGASVAIATRSGDVHLIAPEDEADLARATSGAALTTYSPGQLDTVLDPVEALATPLLDFVRRLGLTRAHLGIKPGYLVQPASYLTQATSALPSPTSSASTSPTSASRCRHPTGVELLTGF